MSRCFVRPVNIKSGVTSTQHVVRAPRPACVRASVALTLRLSRAVARVQYVVLRSIHVPLEVCNELTSFNLIYTRDRTAYMETLHQSHYYILFMYLDYHLHYGILCIYRVACVYVAIYTKCMQ